MVAMSMVISSVRTMRRCFICGCCSVNFTMLSEWIVLRVVGLAHCHALHFNQPTRSAYWCMDYHVGMSREAFGKQLTDYSIVGSVAQIDHHHAYVLHGAVGFSQQRFYILPHAVGLTANVLGIDNLPLVVDTGCCLRYDSLVRFRWVGA